MGTTPTFDHQVWSSFYEGNFVTPFHEELGVFVDKTLLIENILKRLGDSIDNAAGVEADGGPVAIWTGSGSTALVSVEQQVLADTAELAGIPCAWKVGADVDAAVTLSLVAVNSEVIADVIVEIDLNGAAVGACLMNPGAPALVASSIAAVVADNMDLSDKVPGPEECTDLGDLHFECALPLSVEDMALGTTMGPNEVAIDIGFMDAAQAGVHFGADATPSAPVIDNFALAVVDPAYGVHGHCSNARIGYEGRVHIMGWSVAP